MANDYFSFKQFTIRQDRCAFKVGTDGVLLGACADVSGNGPVLDIGTGTGLIALMTAQRCNAVVTGVEPDRESFLQACENVSHSPWKERIRLVNTHIQDFDSGGEKFGLIVTNPPYFSASLKNTDPRKSTARHNDMLGNGELLKSVSALLRKDGRFQVIMPYAEGNVLIAEAQGFGLYCNDILKIRPLPGSEIRRLILAFSFQRQKATEKFLTIERGPRHEFTEEYISLTKDFYLKF